MAWQWEGGEGRGTEYQYEFFIWWLLWKIAFQKAGRVKVHGWVRGQVIKAGREIMASPRKQRMHTDAFVSHISHTFLHCISKMERLARPTPQKWCYNFERKLTRVLSISCSIKTKHIYHCTYVPSFIHINFYFSLCSSRTQAQSGISGWLQVWS